MQILAILTGCDTLAAYLECRGNDHDEATGGSAVRGLFRGA